MKIGLGANKSDMRAVWFADGAVKMIDQRKLPGDLTVVSFRDHAEVASAIKNTSVRGASSIGAAAAYGMCLASLNGKKTKDAADLLKATRPTAYDLFYAVDHMMRRLDDKADPVRAADEYAQAIVDSCIKIGMHGAKLIRDGARIMTHCNAGALASVDVGTALAPVRKAHADGKDMHIFVSETRPRFQGMLTAWELLQEGIPHSVIVDGASGHFMRAGTDMVIVGADHIAANGDFANKIGTYEKAVMAKELNIPFYVAAPSSTFDRGAADGKGIRMEDREEDEITKIGGMRIAPVGSHAVNPSFDITPSGYVTGFITDIGILKAHEIKERMR